MDTWWPTSPKAPLEDTLPDDAAPGKLPGKLLFIILLAHLALPLSVKHVPSVRRSHRGQVQHLGNSQ